MATLESVSATTPDFFSSMTPNLLSAAFLAVLFYASFIDIRERIIPNRAVVAGIALWCISLLAQVVGVIEGSFFVHEPSSAVGLVFNGATSSSAMNASPGSSCELADACSSNLIESILSTAASSVMGAFAVSAFALGCSLAVSCFRGGEPLGAGDVKLLFPIGLFAGFEGGHCGALRRVCRIASVLCGSTRGRLPGARFPFCAISCYWLSCCEWYCANLFGRGTAMISKRRKHSDWPYLIEPVRLLYAS